MKKLIHQVMMFLNLLKIFNSIIPPNTPLLSFESLINHEHIITFQNQTLLLSTRNL
jgi:hypothetical protein